MSVIKWIDEHFEESILIVLLALISSIMMLQIVARVIGDAFSWPEEFARYCYIWTVFLSLGYTIKKGNMLRVTVAMDLLPVKLRKTIELIGNILMLVVLAIFFRYSFEYVGKLRVTGQTSPAMQIPMWIMYWSTIVGFGLGTIRMIQEIIFNFKNFNKEDVETTLEATLKEAKEEVNLSTHGLDDNIDTSGGES